MADTTFHDPLGREITLHDRTWFGHILKRHPELRGQRQMIGPAITNPLQIRISSYDAECRAYYAATSRAAIMLAVVVNVNAGFVKTAFFTDRMKGALEW